MRMTLLGVTILPLLVLPAAAEPVVQPGTAGRPAATAMRRIDFDLLKEAEKQSQQDQAEDAAKKAATPQPADDAAKKAQADKAAADAAAADKAAADKAAADKVAADKVAADKAAADKAAADKSQAEKAAVNLPPPAPPALTVHVPVRLASGAMAGSAALTETSGGLHVLLGFANIPSGRYRLLILPLTDCGRPFAAPAGPAQAIPEVMAGPDGAVAAAFTVRRLTLAAPGGGLHGPVLALYPADARPGTAWLACGTVAR